MTPVYSLPLVFGSSEYILERFTSFVRDNERYSCIFLSAKADYFSQPRLIPY